MNSADTNIEVAAALVPLTYMVDETDFARCSLRQLRGVYDAFRMVESTVGGIVNQPRFITERTHCLNEAGRIVDRLHTHALEVLDVLVAYTKATAPKTPDEAEHKAWILLNYEAYCSDNVGRFVVLAAEQSAAIASAEFDAKHNVRKGA